MPYGIPSVPELEAIASELAIVYLKTRSEPAESPEAFAETYLDAKKRIYDVLASRV